MDERISKLTQAQRRILEQFKDNVKDADTPEWYEDIDYYRWLKARQFDLKKAEHMFRQHVVWRKQMDCENIAEWRKPEAFEKYYPGGFCGETKEGNAIYYMMQGYLDIKGMFYSVRKKDIIKSVIKDMEGCHYNIYPELSRKHGRIVDQSIIIFDMEGMGLKHLWKPNLECFHEVLTNLDLNYPERLKQCYVINVTWLFSIVWNVTKPFLSEDTKNKVIVTGSDWKAELLKHIEADQLPAVYGGSATDPDGNPRLETKLCWGGTIPEKYKNHKPNLDLSKFTTHTVGRGSSFQVDITVQNPGSVLSWQYWTEGADVGFGVYRRTRESRQRAASMEEMVRSERLNSHIVPEDGRLTCHKPGTYVLRFDNTYSWVTSKRVSYCIELLEPDNTHL